MLDEPTSLAGRRHLIDGGYALLLLAIAIVAGYLIRAPPARGAPPLARPWPEPRTGLLIDGPRPAEPMRARQSWPKMVTGKILDGDRQPLEGASIVLDSREYRTGSDGTFEFEGAPSRTPLCARIPGLEKGMVEPQRRPVEVVLRPHVVKAAYLTYFGVGDRVIRTRVLDLTARTELNAVVIDVKGDRGWILYPTDVIEAVAAGARGPATLRDFDALMSTLKSRGIYTIARIVAFKDNVLARHRPDLAIIDTRTGQPWIDNERLAWVDPFREEVWDYNIAIAREAVRRGFDEVQFDYVRFPTDGRLGAAQYSKPNTKATRLPAIVAFLERARHELGVMGAFVAADVFGYTAFNENDTDIGQRVEELTPHLDYISPMVYPSGYNRKRRSPPNEAPPRRRAHPDRRPPARVVRRRRVAGAQRARPRDDPRVPQDRLPRGALDTHARELPARPRDALRARVSPHRPRDRKSTRLNSSHLVISYAVFCLKKKKKTALHKEPDSHHRRAVPAVRLYHPARSADSVLHSLPAIQTRYSMDARTRDAQYHV